MDISKQMRADWDVRAKTDAHFYVAFGGHGQSEDDFLASAAEVMPMLESEFVRLPPAPSGTRRGLEIGCGPGRLMLPMSRHFTELHGVDVSEEMIVLARERLRDSSAQVHATSGADLGIFANDYFDFVYSYIVFQHIPDRGIVLNYLREAQRVLKPGGVLCCQLRGTPPLPSEMSRESATWTGCFFSAGDMVRFSTEQAFPLVAISGLDTQYMWTTFRKALTTARQSRGRITVNGVTAAGGPGPIHNRGRGAAISLWIEGMPEGASIADFRVLFGDREQTGCYLSPVSDSGGCQFDARLPDGMAPGEYAVRLKSEGPEVEGTHPIVVETGPPFRPRLLSVTDGINLTSANRIVNRSAKVTIEDVPDPGKCSFTVAGRPAEYLQYECIDPITATFDFSFSLGRGTPSGQRALVARVGGFEMEPVNVEVLA